MNAWKISHEIPRFLRLLMYTTVFETEMWQCQNFIRQILISAGHNFSEYLRRDLMKNLTPRSRFLCFFMQQKYWFSLIWNICYPQMGASYSFWVTLMKFGPEINFFITTNFDFYQGWVLGGNKGWKQGKGCFLSDSPQ